jgi:hypothetical protein
MLNVTTCTPETQALNPMFPELKESEIKDLMTALRGSLTPESYRKLHVCTFIHECTGSGDKDE